jgi:RHS repeat-associated protein
VTRIDYEPDDKVHAIHFNQGVVQTMTYDPNRRWMTAMEVDGPQGGAQVGLAGQISKWTYDYYPDARLKSELREGLTFYQRTFDYDPAGRILAMNPTDGYDYDLAGNIIRHNNDTYVYSDSAHPDGVTQAGNTMIAYDPDGQMISHNASAITWDPLGRMTQVGADSSAVNYLFASDGSLARRQAGGDTAVYFNPYVERLPGGDLALNYLLDGSIVARREPPFGPYYFHHDRLGSITEMTQDNGLAAELYRYDGWGRSTTTQGQINEFRFAGGREDSSTGLVRMGVRSLDPVLGRFISPDPLIGRPTRLLDLNPYVYAQDDPINLTDPTGLQSQNQDDSLSADLASVVQLTSQVLDTVSKIESPKFIVAPAGARNLGPVPVDPLDAFFLALRGILESSAPELRLLALPFIRDFAKGGTVSASAGGCLGFCFLSLEVDAGFYLTPPKGPNDKYFHDLHLDFSVGGAFLGVTPQSNIEWLSPDAHITEQLALGLGAAAGVSMSGYMTQATTREDHMGYSRQLTLGGGPYTSAISSNSAGQMTLSAGRSEGPGAMAATYNVYTFTSPGAIETVRQTVQGQPFP